MNVGLPFPHSYRIEQLELQENDYPDTYSFTLSAFDEPEELLRIRVYPRSGEEWVARFSRGHDSDDAITGVFSLPNPHTLCVLAAGQGYIIPSKDPAGWSAVGVFPVVDIRAIPERGLVVMTDFTRMEAYGIDGKIWRTRRLSFDGLRIARVTSEQIEAVAWSAPDDIEVEVAVHLVSGRHHGGASPEQNLWPSKGTLG